MENIVAKKKFGQNFLKDKTVLQKIVEAMPNNDNKIVEIGPGLGDLTKFLVDVKSVEAIDESYDLVANLPYYIATNIILKALADPKCKNILVMVQLEVAEKFCAHEGDKVFGSLSIITQSVGDAHIVVKVPPTAFDPQPKIDSAVFLIQKRSDRCDKDFEDMLRVAFTQPRKTLMKNLSSMYEKTILQDAFDKLNLAQTVRPHQVSTRDYHQLYKITRSLDGTRESGN